MYAFSAQLSYLSMYNYCYLQVVYRLRYIALFLLCAFCVLVQSVLSTTKLPCLAYINFPLSTYCRI